MCSASNKDGGSICGLVEKLQSENPTQMGVRKWSVSGSVLCSCGACVVVGCHAHNSSKSTLTTAEGGMT